MSKGSPRLAIYIQSDSLGGQRYIVVSVGAGVGPFTWCSTTNATMDIICGA